MSEKSVEQKLEELTRYTAGLMLGVAALCIKLDELGVMAKADFSDVLAKAAGDSDQPSTAALRDLAYALRSDKPPGFAA